jgi:hypothetical protein
VKKIGNNAFYNCQAWQNIDIPNSVETIGNDAFALCIGAESARIGNSVKKLGMRCFTDCENLKTLSIGPSVKEIGNMAFFNCEGLTEVRVHAVEPPVAPDDVFSDYSAKLYVPIGMTSIYKGASDNCWPLFSSYAEFAAESGVEELISDFDENQPVSVYNLSGIYVGSTTDNLASDVYIVRQGNKVRKISVK